MRKLILTNKERYFIMVQYLIQQLKRDCFDGWYPSPKLQSVICLLLLEKMAEVEEWHFLEVIIHFLMFFV